MLQELCYPRYPNDTIIPIDEASLVVYAFSEELNYPQISTKSSWFNLELFTPNISKTPLTALVSEDFMKRCFKFPG